MTDHMAEAERLLDEAEQHQMEGLVMRELADMVLAAAGGDRNANAKAALAKIGLTLDDAWALAHQHVLDRLSWKP